MLTRVRGGVEFLPSSKTRLSAVEREARSNSRNREVDNCGILLHKEVVLSESLDTKDEIWRQLGELEALQKILFVSLIFLEREEVFLKLDTERRE